MKYKIQTFSKNLLKDFLKSNLHLGSPKSEVQNNMNKLLYGFRNNISILNLNHTFVSLQRFFMLVHNLRSTNQHILFLGFPVWLTHQWKKLETKSNGVYKFFNDDLDLAYIGKHSKKLVLFLFSTHNYPTFLRLFIFLRNLISHFQDLQVPPRICTIFLFLEILSQKRVFFCFTTFYSTR